MKPDQQELIHTLRHAAEDIRLLRTQLSVAENQLRIVSIFERAMFGPHQSQGMGPDSVWLLKRLADQIESQQEAPEAQQVFEEDGA